MPVRRLAAHPSLEHLKYQATDILHQHAACRLDVAQKLREFHPKLGHLTDVAIFNTSLKLSDAQLTLAREYGFDSWMRLKRHVEKPETVDQLTLPHHERIDDPVFRQAVALLDVGDTAALRLLLQQQPQLIHQHLLFQGGNYFRTPTLLEFIAENPVRHGSMPANLIEVARILLDAGPAQTSRDETLALVATGTIARECNLQVPLIELLCAYGADPQTPLRGAAVLGEHAAVHALLQQGARLDLPVAAALGFEHDFHQLLPGATADERHLALAVAAQFGHAELVRTLLAAGEDPNRYNPPGGHSHGTPLHHAAAAGNEAMVRLLVVHGARLDLKDVLWQATPAEWAAHEGKSHVAAYLREVEESQSQAGPSS